MYRINKVTLEGNLASDPKFKVVGKSTPLVELKLAVDRPRKPAKFVTTENKDTPRDDVDFIKVIAWNSLAEQCLDNLKKGDGVYVEAVLRTRNIVDNEGVNRRILEVVAKEVRFGIRKREDVVESDEVCCDCESCESCECGDTSSESE